MVQPNRTVQRPLARLTQRVQHALRSALGSLLPRAAAPPAAGQLITPWYEDALRTYPSSGLTPARALALLRAADAGLPQQQFELFSEMLQKWPRLSAVEATRRLSLTGLTWEITPAHLSAQASPTQRRLAAEAAAFCHDTLHALDGFDTALDHLALGLGYGISVAELVWESGRLHDVVPVPHTRLTADAREPWRLRIRTADAPSDGVALDDHPHKWVVHQPRCTPGRPFEGGLLRRSVLLFVAQNLGFKDWLIYSQIAGMPLRLGQFEPGTPEAEKRQLLRLLESLGTDAVAAVSKNVDVRFIEAGRGEKPYLPLQDYCNTEITILWLGQHLTTDLRSGGSRAAAEVHNRIREDLLTDDIADESATLRRDVLRPLVQARFGDAAPLPRFRRSLSQTADTRELAQTLAVAVRELGLPVSRRWAHQALGIPEAQADEPLLGGAAS